MKTCQQLENAYRSMTDRLLEMAFTQEMITPMGQFTKEIFRLIQFY